MIRRLVLILATTGLSLAHAAGPYDGFNPTYPAPDNSIGAAIADGTTGSVLFLGTGGVLTQDNPSFFWDNSNNRLGLGTSSPGSTLELSRTAAFTGSVDEAAYVDWSGSPGAAGLMVGVYSNLTSTYTGTEASGGHPISMFGRMVVSASGNEQLAVGVEGYTLSASTMTDHIAYGLVGRGILATDDAQGTNATAVGARLSGEATEIDGETARSTGTVIGLLLPGNKGGASGKTYGIKQDVAAEVNQFAGFMNFQNFIILAPISGGVACSAGLSGWTYTDSTADPDELCFCNGTAWQGISSGTDANCA